MKNTINNSLLILLCLLCHIGYGFSQLDSVKTTLKLIRSVKISKPTKVSIDIYENLYTADFKGNVVKLDSSGRVVLQYSPIKKAEVSALEARRNVNIFLFNKNLQEYYFLDRFLALNNTNRFSQDIGFARAASVSSDNNIWVIDEMDFSLKKYGIHKQSFLLKTPLDLILDPKLYQINYLTEYQNLLFINDENSGVLVFDNLGNFKNKTGIKDVTYFNFILDTLYFIKGDKLFFYNIYTSSIVRSIILPLTTYNFVLCGEGKIFLFGDEQLDIYSIK